MTWNQKYDRAKQRLLNDEAICTENRELFARFFDFEEYKLKRINRLAQLDDGTYKTLLYYVSRLRTVNRWFENKPWNALTKEDIKQVYDDLEDGRIRTLRGKPFKEKDTYYRKILRGKPFELAGKKGLAAEVMEFYSPRDDGEVRFIREESFRRIVEMVSKREHKALLWLAWDVGENASTLLCLRRRDFTRQVNEDTDEAEYAVTLRRENLKRGRLPRTEITNYSDTARLLDEVFNGLGDDDLVFRFGTRMAAKMLCRVARLTQTVCIPGGERVTLKVLRSSMACDLLGKGWTTDEVNRRLGHKPSSREIDKYVNWLALDTRGPRKKLVDNDLRRLKGELAEARQHEQLTSRRVSRHEEENRDLRAEILQTQRELAELRVTMQLLAARQIS
ncbi:MAG TPA: hypothetical protein ENI79_01365 [Rhodospirillales bacterium]|nr:hypothetical protein [Rhodospirillales bacterium]